jgi:hypothetical protein
MHGLPWRACAPGFPQCGKMHLDIRWWNSFATRKGKEGRGVITFDNEIGVKVLWRALDQMDPIYSN